MTPLRKGMIHIDKDPTLRTLFLQEALRARGFYHGELDNWEGEKTRDALAAAARYVRSELLPPAPEEAELDVRTLRNLATLDAKAQPTFRRLAVIGKAVAAKHGCTYVMISGNRTWAEQDALYRQPWDGRDNDGDGRIDEADEKVTKAKGGQSNHNFGIAGDFAVFQDGKYLDAANPKLAAQVHSAVADAAQAEGLNIEWGGDWTSFKDYPHFEIRTGLTMAQKRERFQAKGSVL